MKMLITASISAACYFDYYNNVCAALREILFLIRLSLLPREINFLIIITA